jgi:SAM-dependent methyltransferase
MTKLHHDKPRYFEIQYLNSKHSIIPFLKNHFSPSKDMNVLEIGSAEGGVLKAFSDLGCNCLGIELNEKRVALANNFLKPEIEAGKMSFISEDIYNIDPKILPNKFNLIILKDVIEHIHHQEKFIEKIEQFLTNDGLIFFGFPSWRMPFGGHQQISKSKLLAKMPYYHLLPKSFYKLILKVFGESDDIIADLLEIKETGISTKRFEKICKENNYKIVKQIKYLVAPIYEYKFGYKTKILPKWIASIPFFNDFFTFQSYYIIKK